MRKQTCDFCGYPLDPAGRCIGCGEGGRYPVKGEAVDSICGCSRHPLLEAADALGQASSALREFALNPNRRSGYDG